MHLFCELYIIVYNIVKQHFGYGLPRILENFDKSGKFPRYSVGPKILHRPFDYDEPGFGPTNLT